jgi:protein-S-isoprenylcysteine O-methyltransferase Ste14
VPEQKPNRATILIVLAAVVLLAPLLGVFAFSPLMFVWGIEPYQLAVAVGVMLAEALAVGALAWLVIRARK